MITSILHRGFERGGARGGDASGVGGIEELGEDVLIWECVWAARAGIWGVVGHLGVGSGYGTRTVFIFLKDYHITLYNRIDERVSVIHEVEV